MHEAPVDDEADLKSSRDAPVRIETPLPWKTVLVLGIVILSDSISGTVIFPFQGFMVDDFRIADSTTQIGNYSDLRAGADLDRLLRGFPWVQLLHCANILQVLIFLLVFNCCMLTRCSYFYGWLSGTSYLLVTAA